MAGLDGEMIAVVCFRILKVLAIFLKLESPNQAHSYIAETIKGNVKGRYLKTVEECTDIGISAKAENFTIYNDPTHILFQ